MVNIDEAMRQLQQLLAVIWSPLASSILKMTAPAGLLLCHCLNAYWIRVTIGNILKHGEEFSRNVLVWRMMPAIICF